MKKGSDISVKYEGLYLVHQNIPDKYNDEIQLKEHILFIPLQGEIGLKVGKTRHTIGPGRMLFLPSDTKHSFISSKFQGERLIALINTEIWAKILPKALPKISGEKGNGLIDTTSVPLNPLIKEILFYLLLNKKTKLQKSLVHVFVETMGELLDLASKSQEAKGIDETTGMEHLESKIQDRRVIAALEFMRTNFNQRISMNQVAKKSGLSQRSLNRLVLEETGLTPKYILIRYRVSYAQTILLRGEDGITEAAYQSGYQSLSQFINAFRNVTGYVPSEWIRMASYESKKAKNSK